MTAAIPTPPYDFDQLFRDAPAWHPDGFVWAPDVTGGGTPVFVYHVKHDLDGCGILPEFEDFDTPRAGQWPLEGWQHFLGCQCWRCVPRERPRFNHWNQTDNEPEPCRLVREQWEAGGLPSLRACIADPDHADPDGAFALIADLCAADLAEGWDLVLGSYPDGCGEVWLEKDGWAVNVVPDAIHVEPAVSFYLDAEVTAEDRQAHVAAGPICPSCAERMRHGGFSLN